MGNSHLDLFKLWSWPLFPTWPSTAVARAAAVAVAAAVTVVEAAAAVRRHVNPEPLARIYFDIRKCDDFTKQN